MVFLLHHDDVSNGYNVIMNGSYYLMTTSATLADLLTSSAAVAGSNYSNHTDIAAPITNIDWGAIGDAASDDDDGMGSVMGGGGRRGRGGQGPVSHLVTQETLEKMSFAFQMVLIPLLAIFGVVGNILSLVVLVQHRMRSTTNICLAFLAVSDLLLLLSSLYYSAIGLYGLKDPQGFKRARTISYPILGAYLSIVFARITTWLTTMLGVERCIAVYFPMKAKDYNSRRSTLVAIIAIYLLTFILFLPTALQYKVVYKLLPDNTTEPILNHSALGEKTTFTMTYGLVLNVLFRFIPLAILIFVNVAITVAIRRTRLLRRNMSWTSGVSGGRGSGSEQTRITLMLLTVTGVFLVCTLPGAINTIVSRILPAYQRLGAQRNLYLAVSLVTYFLETFNSSVNFVIYMAFSRRFCHTYQEIFCCRSSPWQPWPMSLKTVRFAQPGVGGTGKSSSSLRCSHEMDCLQYRPLPPPLFPTSSGAHRTRYLANGFARSSFDVDDVSLLNGGRQGTQRGIVVNGNGAIHGKCCTCTQANWGRSQSRNRSRSHSHSHSHSNDSVAQQYS